MRSIAFVLLLSTKSIAALRSGQWCFAGCELVVNYVDFNDTGPGSKKIRSCESTLRATSLYLCIDEYCENDGRVTWLQSANETCQQRSNASLPPYDIINRFSPKDRAGFKRLNADDALMYPTLNEVVIPEQTFFERAFATLDAAYFEYGLHRVYGWAMYYFWAIVFSIGTGSRLVSLVQRPRRHGWQRLLTHPADSRNIYSRHHRSIFSGPRAWLKQYVTIPATFNSRCSQPIGWCTIPPRVHSLTIFAFVLLNVVLCSASYRLTEGNLYWPEKRSQLFRYVSDRTGIISLANFPLIWLFGMRNNTLMWMTGWGYGSYNSFHRWVARVSTVQAIIHSVGYTVMVCESGGLSSFKKYLTKHYFWNGELATIFMCALLAFSVYGLRRSHYEVFLTAHIVLSAIVLLTMFYHIDIFPPGEWTPFLYPCLTIWLLDRLLRTLRIFSFNPRFWTTKATATYDANAHLITLRVPCANTWVKPRPGSYYYIYALDNLWYAHQNHPFTVAHIDTEGYSSNMQLEHLDHRPETPYRTESSMSSGSDALLYSTCTTATPSPSLTFLIRPYAGFTSRLARLPPHPRTTTPTTTSTSTPTILLEGPYGAPLPLHSPQPTTLFLTAGTGIALPLSHLPTLYASPSPSPSPIHIIWAVREHAFLTSILHNFSALFDDDRVTLHIHVTRNIRNRDDLPAIAAGVAETKSVTVRAGRPDVRAVVEEVAGGMAGRGERLAVVACGPGGMADEARGACVELVASGFRGVEYFEESFKW